MGMIESIRNRQTLLLTIIGLGMLSFLVPYDAVIAMLGNNPGTQAAGSINGDDVSFLEYRTRVQERNSLFNYTDDKAAQNEVWGDIIVERLYGDNFDALGLGLTKEEFDDIRYGDYVSPWVSRTFYGGQVTEEQKQNWKQTFSTMYSDPAGKANYAGYARVIQQKRMREKFDGMVRAGLAANSLEGKREFLGNQEKVDFRYVLKRYTSIPDGDVEVTDADAMSFYRDHKGDAQYAQRAGRDIEYIRIPLTASFDDRQNAQAKMTELKGIWATDDDGDDFLSENRLMDQTSRLEIIGPALDKESQAANLEAAAVGDVVGPYFEGTSIRLDKVISKDAVADSSVKCRHILLKTADIKDPAQLAVLEARADSLKRRLRAGDAFADLVNKHSEDPGSKATGGEYEFRRGRMVKPFEDFCFDNRVGSIGTAETNYGLHLIEVLDQQWTSDAITIQRVEREVEISSVTSAGAEETAMNFAIEYGDIESFRNAADTMGYAIVEARDVQSGTAAITGLPNGAEVVGWAYGAEPGDVSNPFQIDGNYIIACLANIKEKGVPPFENVEDAMRAGALKDKKAKMYMDLMSTGTLDEAAEAAGETVGTATGLGLKTPTISGSGGAPEPEVVGAAFALELNSLSAPIQGKNGIWVIMPTVRNAVDASGEFTTEVKNLNDRTYFRNLPLSSGAPVRLSNAIVEKAEIEDLRQGS
ncbi:peptidylprolyl isomerase [Flavobacteriales bacterium]|nr:peptidylprolyl isomerase [Flavobacteriales bacterium]